MTGMAQTGVAAGVPCCILMACFASIGGAAPAAGERLDNNLKCVDLSDLTGPLPLSVESSHEILRPSEDWERCTHPTYHPGRTTIGYPTVVRNDHGQNPDGRYYLYYAHHDPNSGVGCAVADAIAGPYRKLAESEPTRKDSRVLVNHGKPGEIYHYSSPCVVWNGDRQLWIMYFHFGSWTYHRAEGWDRGHGHQMTAMATCPDLATHEWEPLVDPTLPHIPAGQLPLTPVLPTTKARWMNSQSAYHAIQRLPDGRWLAFLRGTGMMPVRNKTSVSWDSPPRPMARTGTTSPKTRSSTSTTGTAEARVTTARTSSAG